MIYSLTEIKKSRYKELDVFIASIGGLNVIPKTIIFVNSIGEKMALMEYLYTKFSNNLKDMANQMIRYFQFNLSNELTK